MDIFNQQIKCTKSELAEHYERRESLLSYLYGFVRFMFIIVQNIYCISSYLVLCWIVYLTTSWFSADLYWRVENRLYNSLLFIVSSWSMSAGATIFEVGDEYRHLIEAGHEPSCPDETSNANVHTTKDVTITDSRLRRDDGKDCNRIGGGPRDESSTTGADRDSQSVAETTTIPQQSDPPELQQQQLLTPASDSSKPSDRNTSQGRSKPRILLLCNHISTADVPLVIQSFSTLTNHSLLWVLDALFKPTNFGIICSSHDDFFISKDSFQDGSLRDHVLDHPDRNLLVLFPEGGFLSNRLSGSNRYALRNGLPQTNYVTHPRFGAFKDLIDPSVGVTHIVDTTLLYDDIKNPLSMFHIGMGTRKEPVILHHKIYNRQDVNPTEEWLRNIWLDKDKLARRFYEHRDQVHELSEGTLRAAKLDWFKLIYVHLFYILFFYLIVCRLFSAIISVLLAARNFY